MRRQRVLALGVLVLAGLQAPSSEEIYSRHCLAGCRPPTESVTATSSSIREIYMLSYKPLGARMGVSPNMVRRHAQNLECGQIDEEPFS